MLETYQNEILRKKRASRVFWIIVFLFAGFLYFFFQGYYPSIDLSIRSLTSTGEHRTDPRDLIRSFGIVNVSVKPENATIFLSSGSYSNDEKRMTNYGTYSLLMQHAGYRSYASEFTIGKETPYYIDLMTLLPNIDYTRFETGVSDIANIRDNEWTAITSSGMILYGENFSGKVRISSGVITHIGEGYFLSGTSIVTYTSQDVGWEEKTWSGSSMFIRDCPKNVIIKNSNLWCPKNKKILTENGKSFTGIISIGDDYIEKSDGLLVGDGYAKKIVFGTGVVREKSIFVEKDSLWYTASGGNLVGLGGNGKKFIPSIKTRLDHLEYAKWIEGTLVILGKKGTERFLIFYDPVREKFSKMISFPDVSLDEIRILKKDGNIFFKTKGALLFLYHNSQKVEWLIDGTILAFAPESALYKKDDVIWKASWKSEE